MSFSVLTIPPFDRQLKRLAKKYPSLKSEFAELLVTLEDNPIQGIALANCCYKIRFAIHSKGKGKSGGARIITHLQVVQNVVYLLALYDKSEQTDITDNEINELLELIVDI